MHVPVTLGVLAVLQMLAGLAVQLAILRIVGAGGQTDAYVAAQAMPALVTAIVGASLQSLWMPRFSRLADDPTAYRDEQAGALGQTAKVLIGLCLPLWLTCPLWAGLVFPGFSRTQRDLVVSMSGPLFAAAVLMGHCGVLTAALRAKGRFFVAESTAVISALLALLLTFVLVPTLGIVAAAWIAAVRAGCLAVALTWQSRWPPITLRATYSTREVSFQIRPLIAGSVFIKSSPLVDRFWGSQSVGGGITYLSLAQLAMNALATIAERALLVQTLPNFAKLLKAHRLADLRQAYMGCLRRVSVAVFAVMLGLLMLKPVWADALGYLLKLSPVAAGQLWTMCALLLPALFVSIAGSAAVAVFYAFGETKVPTMISVAGFALSLPIKALLFASMDIVGIAAGASLYLAFNMACYHYAVLRRIGRATKS